MSTTMVTPTMFVAPVAPAAATGAVRTMYDEDLAHLGYIASDTELFSLQPEVYEAWTGLARAVRMTMRLRRYELLTIVAARALGCRACVSAHAALCIRRGIASRQQLEAIVRDFHDAGLEPVEVALMDLVERVAIDAHRVSRDEVEALKVLGLSDHEILAAVLVAAARSFYSKSLEALGVPPSPALVDTNGLLDLAATASAPGDPRLVTSGCA
jgi:uncharacterized peroxidase-related enzyme